ncbi:dTDP-4-dehydrorhamnose 3,5-epimerase [Maricaulis sp.]|uniref:dTDP-4-dehydrorhamnose 3,5-epimerase n=1 Tax=Maricaulis sp. TaxID=1486257 RepID=UPI003A8DEFFB
MITTNLDLEGAKLLTPRRFADERGFFSETYNRAQMAEQGIHTEFVQDNHSKSVKVGTVRGLHYQSPPFAQAKLVRVVRGAIRDVIVDVRIGSPTFGQHVAVRLDSETGAQLFVPAGFLHGFITLDPDTEISYKVDAHYSAECDGSVLWNDPALGIDWGDEAAAAVLSDKDRAATRFEDFKSPFSYR